jgi:SAM-dependent methyltransferase
VNSVRQRELEYHEKLYSGFAQSHFARPAVRALRRHMVQRILNVTGAGPESRVLSLGCGIGDTELLLAPHVAELTGVDLSPAAIRQARADAAKLTIRNVRFEEGGMGAIAEGRSEERCEERYDIVIAIFFLHHLPGDELAALPHRLKDILKPGGVFYSLDPSRHRLSGAVGRLLIPNLMKQYQTADERELDPFPTAELFRGAGLDARVEIYDFGSSPLAGLFPGWAAGYRMARALDDRLLRVPLLRRRGSNFELIARFGSDTVKEPSRQ